MGCQFQILAKYLCMNFDYIKPKYGNRAKLCYMDTDSFLIYIKTEDFHKDIANGVDRWFDTCNYDENKTVNRPLSLGKNKKVIGLFIDDKGRKIMEDFCAIRGETYAYLINGYNGDDYDQEKIINKKVKRTKNCAIKRNLMFENYTDSPLNDKIILRSQ